MTRTAPLVALLLCLPAPLAAQQRSLHWSDFTADATLEADGTLHVEERQTIVFDGAWNGGERRFNIRPRQRFDFIGMRRVDPATGDIRAMEEGDLSVSASWAVSEAGSFTFCWSSQ
jgi:hypothetical protein